MLLPRIAVLVDLPREAAAGGHVKYWERMAQAAARVNAPIDLTVYFSGTGADEVLSQHVRLRFLPPVFSTARLKFLPYVPAHTDLAPHHPRLARELPNYDLIHTTDAFFAFARTAERVARRHHIPLTTSFHTDTPAYAELYTRRTVVNLLGKRFGVWLNDVLKLSARERASKDARLATHLRACAAIMAMRPEDITTAAKVGRADKVKPMRLGVDKTIFTPSIAARHEITKKYGIAPDTFIVLFVGRVDIGKNMPVLMHACAQAIDKGLRLHLLVAGLGPMSREVKAVLGYNATLAGLVEPQELAQFYAAADCLAIVSDIEIGGMIGLEALSCGCPVLVSQHSGVAQAYGNPAALHEVESGVSAWVEALASLARDKPRQVAMRAAALTYRQEKLAGWEDVLMEDFVAVWRRVVREMR